jgi:hypothetical protein
VPGRLGRVIALVFLFATLALAGCDSGGLDLQRSPAPTGSQPFPTGTPIGNLDCPKFKAAATRIADAQSKLYVSGPQAAAAAHALETELTALKKEAPSDVDTAIDDLISAFRSASDLISDPSPSAAEAEQLRKLGPRLSADSQKITQYVTSTCK